MKITAYYSSISLIHLFEKCMIDITFCTRENSSGSEYNVNGHFTRYFVI